MNTLITILSGIFILIVYFIILKQLQINNKKKKMFAATAVVLAASIIFVFNLSGIYPLILFAAVILAETLLYNLFFRQKE